MLNILLFLSAFIVLVSGFVIFYGYTYRKWASKQSIIGTWKFTGQDFSVTYQFVEENKDGGLFYRLHEGKENRFRVFGRWLLQDYSNLKLLPLSSELPERFIIGEEHPAKLHFIIDQENKITISEGNQNFNMEKIERDIKEEFDSPAKKEMNN